MLVLTVKTILYVMCPSFKFNNESLRNALYEIEFMIISRLLPFVALDLTEGDVLKPNKFLLRLQTATGAKVCKSILE